eukprot:781406-Alexandrium_andersonii.AAC.1
MRAMVSIPERMLAQVGLHLRRAGAAPARVRSAGWPRAMAPARAAARAPPPSHGACNGARAHAKRALTAGR